MNTDPPKVETKIEDYDPDLLYNPDFMETDGMYDQNIKMLWTFCYSKETEVIINDFNYNGSGLSTKGSTLNRFKSPLEACVVVGGQNRDSISHWTFYSNKYACSHFDDDSIYVGSNGMTSQMLKHIIFLEYL